MMDKFFITILIFFQSREPTNNIYLFQDLEQRWSMLPESFQERNLFRFLKELHEATFPILECFPHTNNNAPCPNNVPSANIAEELFEIRVVDSKCGSLHFPLWLSLNELQLKNPAPQPNLHSLQLFKASYNSNKEFYGCINEILYYFGVLVG